MTTKRLALAGACWLLLGTGCLVLADPPTSVKLLEPDPEGAFDTPYEGSIVYGLTEVELSLDSTLEIEGTLSIDGEEVDNGSGDGFSYNWDTTAYDKGRHTLTLDVQDEVERTDSVSIEVTVDQLPVVDLYEPVEGDTLSGEVDLDFDVDDDGQVESMAAVLGGVVLAEDETSPFRLSIDTCDVDSGSLALRVEATDDVGNVGAAEIQVESQRPMVVELTMDDLTLEPQDLVQAEVAWDAGPTRVWFELDGVEIGSLSAGGDCSLGCPDRCMVYEADWDTTDLADGTYELQVLLEDDSGRTRSDSATVRVLRDSDGDGYDHSGYGGDDCDDDDANVHPGASDICNDIDDDCDGVVDEGFDDDGDGYAGGSSCPDEAWADCDDDDADVNPGATEVCGDGIDNNCDGPNDACRQTGSTTAADTAWASFEGESSFDYMGSIVGPAGDLDGDGVDDMLIGSWSGDLDQADSDYTGMVYAVSGSVEDGSHSLGDAMARIDGRGSEANFGASVAALGDVDGDGYDEIAIGEPFSSYGSVYVFSGPLSSALDTGDAFHRLSWSGSTTTGFSLAAGDFDDDGDTDLVVGTCKLSSSGVVALYRGPLDYDRSSPHVELDGDSGAEGCSAATAPDVDGDGIDDVILGAPADSTAADWAGAAWLVTDMPGSDADLADIAQAHIKGTGEQNQAGWAVAGAGDVDGDGHGDVLMGSYMFGTDDGGRAWLILGPMAGSFSVTAADATFTGSDGDSAGWALAGVDYDGDGLRDVVIGSPDYDDPTYVGAASLFYGALPSGTYSLPDDADLSILGTASGTWLGTGLANLGDLDEDGADELLVGAQGRGADDAGGAFLFYGQAGD